MHIHRHIYIVTHTYINVYTYQFTTMVHCMCKYAHMHVRMYMIQWNLSITDTLGPDIFGYFLLQYRGFPLLEIKILSVTYVGAKFFALIMEAVSIVSLI